MNNLKTEIKDIEKSLKIRIHKPSRVMRLLKKGAKSRQRMNEIQAWAKGVLVSRVPFSENFVLELNNDNKAYILRRNNSTSLQLVGICDKPSTKLMRKYFRKNIIS